MKRYATVFIAAYAFGVTATIGYTLKELWSALQAGDGHATLSVQPSAMLEALLRPLWVGVRAGLFWAVLFAISDWGKRRRFNRRVARIAKQLEAEIQKHGAPP